MSTQFTNRQWRLPNEENKSKVSNYSMDFDSASSDYIDLGTTTDYDNGDLSASIWVYASSARTSTAYAFSNSGSPTIAGFDIAIKTNNNVRVSRNTRTKESGSGWISIGFTDDAWQHLAFTYNEATNTIKLFLNGVLKDISTGTTSSNIASKKLTIGSYIGTISLFEGKLDGAAIFNYTLSDGGVSVGQTATGDIAALYGSSSTGIGNPITLNPVAFYNLGDKSAFNGANYLVPNIAAQEDDGDIAVSYSPYALDFDGANDYIDCGNPSIFNDLTSFSFSCWFNSNVKGNDDGVLGKWLSGTHRSFALNLETSGASSNIRFIVFNSSGANAQAYINGSDWTTGNWYNVSGTYDGNNVKLYLNSVLKDTVALTGTVRNATHPFKIGVYGSSSYFDGKLSNVSFWNTDLTSAQVTEIYNEGLPGNLNSHSAYSNLISWWQLGSNSSFNTNWTVLDEKGSNNGTSVNMNEGDIVDGVGSYANGLSSGMGGDEVIGDAPYSTANALSVNMDVLDRVTDTPS